MTIDSIKKINITLLISEPINHSLVNQTSLLSLFNVVDKKTEDFKKYSFVQAPGLTVLNLIEEKKEIIFDYNRVLINDLFSTDPDSSNLAECIMKFVDGANLIQMDKIAAIGFNFTLVADNKKKINYNNILTKKTLESFIGKGENIEKAGFKINVLGKKAKKEIQLNSISEGKSIIAANYHFDGNTIIVHNKIREEMKESFNDLLKIINKVSL